MALEQLYFLYFLKEMKLDYYFNIACENQFEIYSRSKYKS